LIFFTARQGEVEKWQRKLSAQLSYRVFFAWQPSEDSAFSLRRDNGTDVARGKSARKTRKGKSFFSDRYSLLMTKKEAQRRVEVWLRAHSPFTAIIVGLTVEEDGSWRALISSEGMSWQQIVSPRGEVGRPLMLD
jgi:hypothetical protein